VMTYPSPTSLTFPELRPRGVLSATQPADFWMTHGTGAALAAGGWSVRHG
jgi:hypothetical protein